MHRLNLFLIMTTALAAAFAQTSPVVATGAYSTGLTVPPKASTPIAMKVIPKSWCVLHAEGSNDQDHSIRLLADDDGLVRFYVQPSSESDQAAAFQVDCQTDSQSAQFPLKLRGNSSPTPDMPAPPTLIPQPKTDARVRPALSDYDANYLSAEELLGRGYPPRPDPVHAPDAFRTWLRAVTKAATFIEPRLVPNPGVTHTLERVTASAETTSNWSGYELRGSSGSYTEVFGTWTVPQVIVAKPGATYSAFWIGLDGDGTSDLVQDGTEQNITEVCILGNICFTFTSYYAWTEFLPQQGTEQGLGGFSVSPGDEIYSSVIMCNTINLGPITLCFPQYNGTDAQFVIENVTRSEYTAIYTPRGNTFVGGSEAEWIMERPAVNNSLPDLAAYGDAVMSGANACGSASSCTDYNSPPTGVSSVQITMKNGADVLSVVEPVTPTKMIFFWERWE